MPTLLSAITRQSCQNSRISVPRSLPQKNHRRIRIRDPGHVGCSVLLLLVHVYWWCWPLWHCFTRITITLAEPKNGLWRGDFWYRKIRQLLHRGIKNITIYQIHIYNCRILYFIVNVAFVKKKIRFLKLKETFKL